MPYILIVEDDLPFAGMLLAFFKKNGYEAQAVQCVADACRQIQLATPALLLLDYRLPDGTALDILDFINGRGLQLPAMIMTSFHDIRTTVQAIKKGASDYITKPVHHEELLMLVRELYQPEASRPAARTGAFDAMVQGSSAGAAQLYEHIELVAATGMSVLILGESGTGKEHIARTIHQLSSRSAAPFVAIDCGALSSDLAGSELFGHVKGAFTGALSDKKGQFEAAAGGTVFLDEVGNLNYDIQVKLLRALQEHEVYPIGSNMKVQLNIRLITATNEDLRESVRKGQFREDLYHRLNEFKLRLAPLRERLEDLDAFVRFFTERANQELGRHVQGISPDVRSLFEAYHWPGNLRELKNIIKRGVLLARGPLITMNELPEEMEFSALPTAPATNPDLKALQEQSERDLILKTLREEKFNKSKAARRLNIDRSTLYYKMAKYHIEG